MSLRARIFSSGLLNILGSLHFLKIAYCAVFYEKRCRWACLTVFLPGNDFLPTHDTSIFRKAVVLELTLSRYAPVHILLVLVQVCHLCYSCDVSDFRKHDDFYGRAPSLAPDCSTPVIFTSTPLIPLQNQNLHLII